jgi:hypothetical protein
MSQFCVSTRSMLVVALSGGSHACPTTATVQMSIATVASRQTRLQEIKESAAYVQHGDEVWALFHLRGSSRHADVPCRAPKGWTQQVYASTNLGPRQHHGDDTIGVLAMVITSLRVDIVILPASLWVDVAEVEQERRRATEGPLQVYVDCASERCS